jgi:serine kinase of HPr protein (carbohydrate metabolism regulator)
MTGASTQIHASCVAIDGRGVLIAGPSGAGKSDLALRLIDRGAQLVSDDYTDLVAADGALVASAPDRIRGLIEVRGLGIVTLPVLDRVPVALHVDLGDPVPRLPETGQVTVLAGIPVASIRIAAHEASAPIKVELALKPIPA